MTCTTAGPDPISREGRAARSSRAPADTHVAREDQRRRRIAREAQREIEVADLERPAPVAELQAMSDRCDVDGADDEGLKRGELDGRRRGDAADRDAAGGPRLDAQVMCAQCVAAGLDRAVDAQGRPTRDGGMELEVREARLPRDEGARAWPAARVVDGDRPTGRGEQRRAPRRGRPRRRAPLRRR